MIDDPLLASASEAVAFTAASTAEAVAATATATQPQPQPPPSHTINTDPLFAITRPQPHTFTPSRIITGESSEDPQSRPPTPPTKQALPTAPKLVPEPAQSKTQPGDHPSAYAAPPPPSASASKSQLQQPGNGSASAVSSPPQRRELFVRIRITGIEILPRAVTIHLDAAANLPHFRSSSYPRITRSYREFVLYALALTLSLPSVIIPALPVPLPSLSSSTTSAISGPTPEQRHLKFSLSRWIVRLLEHPLIRDHLETRNFIESDYSYQPTPPTASASPSAAAARKRWNSLMHAASSITGLPEKDFPEGIVHAVTTGEGFGAVPLLLTSSAPTAATSSSSSIDIGAGMGLPHGAFSTPTNGPSNQYYNSSGGGTFSASRISSFLKFGQSSSPSPASAASPAHSANRLSTSRSLHDDDEDLVQARAEVTRLEMHFANAAAKADKVYGSTAPDARTINPSTDSIVASNAAGARAGVSQATYDLATRLHSLAMNEESRPISVKGGLTRSLKSTSEMLRQSLKVEDAISNASTHALLSALCYQSLNARSAKCALLQRNALVEEHHNASKHLVAKRREADALRAGRSPTSRMRADMIIEELNDAIRSEAYLAQALRQLSASLTSSLIEHSKHTHTDLQGALLDHTRSQLSLNRSLVGGLKALRRELDTLPTYEQVIAQEKTVAEERKRNFHSANASTTTAGPSGPAGVGAPSSAADAFVLPTPALVHQEEEEEKTRPDLPMPDPLPPTNAPRASVHPHLNGQAQGSVEPGQLGSDVLPETNMNDTNSSNGVLPPTQALQQQRGLGASGPTPTSKAGNVQLPDSAAAAAPAVSVTHRSSDRTQNDEQPAVTPSTAGPPMPGLLGRSTATGAQGVPSPGLSTLNSFRPGLISPAPALGASSAGYLGAGPSEYATSNGVRSPGYAPSTAAEAAADPGLPQFASAGMTPSQSSFMSDPFAQQPEQQVPVLPSPPVAAEQDAWATSAGPSATFSTSSSTILGGDGGASSLNSSRFLGTAVGDEGAGWGDQSGTESTSTLLGGGAGGGTGGFSNDYMRGNSGFDAGGSLNSSRFMGGGGGFGGSNGGGLGGFSSPDSSFDRSGTTGYSNPFANPGSNNTVSPQRSTGQAQGGPTSVQSGLNQGGSGAGSRGAGGAGLFGRSRISASDAAKSLGGTF
ncbi:Vacuolar protein sorting-associated protein 17 [Tilletia horrida]|nr:Vacuolar protein sorting-associated protein 17 [Tilletia horrida]